MSNYVNGQEFERNTKLTKILPSKGDFEINHEHDILRNGKYIGSLYYEYDMYKFVLPVYNINWKKRVSSQIRPDEMFIDYDRNKIFIIEKKYQNEQGSVSDKLPSCDFRKREFEKLFEGTGFDIEFCYLCNTYLKKDKSLKDTFEYIKYKNCECFFEDEIDSLINWLGIFDETVERKQGEKEIELW